MITKQVFKGTVDKYENIKQVDVTFLKKLKDLAEKDFIENISQNWNKLEDFYAGKQWNRIELKKGTSYNSLGQSYYDTANTYQDLGDSKLKPKRIQNITKSNIQTLVSNFAQKDPMPVARSRGNYNYDKELNHKIDILLNILFKEENDFNAMYKGIVEPELVYGHYFVQTKIDEDKAKTELPIKFRYINPRDIRVDPEATTIDEADFFIHMFKIKYWELKELTDYQFQKEFNKDKEPEDMFMCNVDIFWIRTKNNLNQNKWVNLWIYENKWLKLVDEKKQPMPFVVYDDLPFEIFRVGVGERWYGTGSLAVDIIPINIERNKALSEMDWNWMMYSEPPLLTDMDIEDVKRGQKPGGVVTQKSPNKRLLQPLSTMTGFISSGEYGNRLAMLDQEVAKVIGNVGVLGGENPTGTYSGAKLDLLRKGAELKPAMIEEENLKAISRLAEKALRLLALYLDSKGGGISLFDAEKGKKGSYTEITTSDIQQAIIKIDVQTKDANLMTKEAKLNIIKDFMQYGKIQENIPYYMLVDFYNESVSGLFPDIMRERLKKDWESGSTPQQQQMALQAGQAGQSSEELPIGQAEIPTEEAQMDEDGMTPDEKQQEFMKLVDEYRQTMDDAGVPQDKIEEIMLEVVDNELAQGTEYEIILQTLEEMTNKTIQINNERLRNRKK